jgi:hypothetical protein
LGIIRLVTVLVSAAVSVAITLAVMLNFVTTHSAAASHPGRADATLCVVFASATTGSPASFRLADEIASAGGC